MKKAVLLLIVALFAPNLMAVSRVITTSRPFPPYNRRVNPFIRPYYRHYARPYNSYFGRNFIRPYYGNTFGRIYNGTYYPVYYGANTYSRPYEEYEVQSNNNAAASASTEEKPMFDKFFTMRRTLEQTGDYAPEEEQVLNYKLKSLSGDSIVDVANKENYTKDPRLSLVEKNIYGKTFEHQTSSLRLNRLEKEMFDKTYPAMSESERINNLFVNYNSKAVSEDAVAKLEMRVFNKTFEDKANAERISNLEERVFGTIQSGDLKRRLATLEHALVAKKPEVVQDDPYSTCYGDYGTKSGWRNTLSRAGRYFSGYPTGVTPPVIPYAIPNFGFNGGGIQQGYRDNWGGYAYSNTMRGGGMGVHILD